MWVTAAFSCGLKSLFRRGNWCEGTASKAVVWRCQGSAQSMGAPRWQMEMSFTLKAVTLDSCRWSQGDVRNPNSSFVISCVLKAQRQYLEMHFPCSSWIWGILSPPLAFHCSISVIPRVTQVEWSFYLTLAKWLGVFYRYFSCLFNLCNLSSSSALCRKVLQACGTHWVRRILFSVCFEPASAFMSWLTVPVLRDWTILPIHLLDENVTDPFHTSPKLSLFHICKWLK